MKHSELVGKFEDERGKIEDLLVTDNSSTTYITFKAGAVRGNHFHKETDQTDLIISGNFQCYSGNKMTELEEGDVIHHNAWVPHAYKAITDGEMVSVCFGKRIGENYGKDTFKLDTPLC